MHVKDQILLKENNQLHLSIPPSASQSQASSKLMLIKPFLGNSVLGQLSLEVDFKMEMGVHEVCWEMIL